MIYAVKNIDVVDNFVLIYVFLLVDSLE